MIPPSCLTTPPSNLIIFPDLFIVVTDLVETLGAVQGIFVALGTVREEVHTVISLAGCISVHRHAEA